MYIDEDYGYNSKLSNKIIPYYVVYHIMKLR